MLKNFFFQIEKCNFLLKMEPCESQCDAKKWIVASEQKMWLWKGRSGSNSKESNANLGKAHSAILFTNPVFLNQVGLCDFQS